MQPPVHGVRCISVMCCSKLACCSRRSLAVAPVTSYFIELGPDPFPFPPFPFSFPPLPLLSSSLPFPFFPCHSPKIQLAVAGQSTQNSLSSLARSDNYPLRPSLKSVAVFKLSIVVKNVSLIYSSLFTENGRNLRIIQLYQNK